MKPFAKLLCLVVVIATLSGCASIVSKSNWPITFHSNPSGADISITNRKGMEVYSGKTPATLQLKSGSAFFSKESYTVVLKMNGFETKKFNVECKLNGWYFGNIVFGALIGFLIVDPATGAMYKLQQDFYDENLVATGASTTQAPAGQPSLQVLSKDQLPAGWEKHLVRMGEGVNSQ